MASTKGIRAGRAFVELFADDSKLVRGLRRAEKRLKAFGDRIRNFGLKIAGLGTAMLTPMLGAAKAFSSMGDQVAKMAKRTGLSVEALSELNFVASQTGTSLEAMETGLRRMQRSIYDAGRGLSTQTDALKDIGLTYKDLAGLAPEEQFKKLADAISRVEDPTRKAALAQALFGRAGTQLLPMMAKGAAGIEALQKEARRLGLTMSAEDAKAAEDFTDSLDKLWKVVKMGVFRVGAALAPVLQRLADTITGVATKISAWIDQNRAIVVAVLKVVAVVLASGVALMTFGAVISGLGSVIGGLISVISTVGVAFKAIGVILGAILSPIGLIVAAVAALGGYLIYASGAGGKAVSWLGEKFSKLAEDARKAFGGIADALAAGDIALAARILWNTLKLWWIKGTEGLRRIWIDFKAGFVKIFAEAFYGGLKVARKVWQWLEIGWVELTTDYIKAWHSFVEFFQKSWERIKAAAQKAWNWIKSLFDDSINLEAENKLVEQEKQKAISNIENEQQRKIAQREAKRQQDRQKIDAEANAFYDKQDEEKRLLRQAADDVANAEQAKLTQQITDLKKQRDDAIAEARMKRMGKDMASGSAPDQLEGPDKMLADAEKALSGIGATMQQQAEKVTAKGTFNAAALQGLQGSDSVQKQIATATEETKKDIKKLTKFVVDQRGVTATWGR